MITFEQICSQLGLEPKAVRTIIKGKYRVSVKPIKVSHKEKAYQLEQFLNWYLNYLADAITEGKDR